MGCGTQRHTQVWYMTDMIRREKKKGRVHKLGLYVGMK